MQLGNARGQWLLLFFPAKGPKNRDRGFLTSATRQHWEVLLPGTGSRLQGAIVEVWVRTGCGSRELELDRNGTGDSPAQGIVGIRGRTLQEPHRGSTKDSGRIGIWIRQLWESGIKDRDDPRTET